jgi:hypothetical protein
MTMGCGIITIHLRCEELLSQFCYDCSGWCKFSLRALQVYCWELNVYVTECVCLIQDLVGGF